MYKSFNDYYMSIGIEVEHSIPHVHLQNGLAEATQLSAYN